MTTNWPIPAVRWRGTLAQTMRFGFVGLLNTAIALSLIWLLMVAGASPYVANLAGYALGLVISFTLNRIWTFRQRGPVKWTQVIQFLLACGASYLLNLATVALALQAGTPSYPAQIAGVPVYTACFFLMSKYVVFTPPRRDEAI